MSQEQKANNAQSTLNGTINSSVTSLTVVSAASFPTVPQFRIRLDNELCLVTALAGAVFTITRSIESTVATSHTSGVEVTLVETEAGQVRNLRDFANPLFGLTKPMQLLDAAGAALTASSFTDVNMTNASKADVAGGSIVMTHDTQSSSNDYGLITKAAPTPPWIWRVGFIPNLLNEVNDFPSCGPVVHENSSGEFYAFQVNVSTAGQKVLCPKFSSPTASSGSFLDFDNWYGGGLVVWFEIEDNNTNLIFRFSSDGVNFITLGQEARTTFLTPDEIGFTINNFGNLAVESMVTIVSWNEIES